MNCGELREAVHGCNAHRDKCFEGTPACLPLDIVPAPSDAWSIWEAPWQWLGC
jgi:hypothetical protein